jgi:hypothetical protein
VSIYSTYDSDGIAGTAPHLAYLLLVVGVDEGEEDRKVRKTHLRHLPR